MKRVSNISSWAFVLGGLTALSLWPSLATAGELQNILDKSKAFAALPTLKHTTAFRLERFDPVQYRKEAQGVDPSFRCTSPDVQGGFLRDQGPWDIFIATHSGQESLGCRLELGAGTSGASIC